MTSSISFFRHQLFDKPKAAIFLSGSGSNAQRILEHWRQAAENAPFEPEVLVTDAPRTSRARELSEMFELPVVENDIRLFYRRHGETRCSIASIKGQRIRKEWTDELRRQLAEFTIDFGILAGFMSLTNLTADFPCLNVHPGDLTYKKNGRRLLVGLHTAPVERAILEGLSSMRSSVIVAQPYTESGENMDSGPILGLSEAVPIDLHGVTLDELIECARSRPNKKPTGGFGDLLEKVAKNNQERLKVEGDWEVFPGVVFDFAADRFALDDEGGLLFRMGDRMLSIKTVIYSGSDREIIFNH